MYYSENGDETKKFNTKDGMGFSMLKQHGILTGIVTGENVRINRRRAEKLKMDFCIMGCNDKVSAVEKLCNENNIKMGNIAYMGDDINDLELIKMVGLGISPANAVSIIKEHADIVTTLNGGDGAVREAIDIVLNEA
jgi:N-acylneuraminate cytidylyltransferase